MVATYLGNIATLDTKPTDAGDRMLALGQVDTGRILSLRELLLEGAPGVGGSLDSVDAGGFGECLIVDLHQGVP